MAIPSIKSNFRGVVRATEFYSGLSLAAVNLCVVCMCMYVDYF